MIFSPSANAQHLSSNLATATELVPPVSHVQDLPTSQAPLRRIHRSRLWLIQSALLLATVSVGAIAVGSYQIVRTMILDNLKRQVVLEVRDDAQSIDRWLATQKAEVLTLANSPLTRTRDWAVIKPYFLQEVSRQKEAYQLVFAKPDGSYYGTNFDRAKANARDRQWFTSAIAGNVNVTDPIIGRTTGKPIFNISAPIRSTDNSSVLGVISQSVELNRLVEIVDNLQYGTGSYAFALNSKGIPIAHPDPDQINTLEKPVASWLQSRNGEMAAIAHKMISHQEGIQKVTIDGTQQYIAYLPLHEANWSIGLVIPKNNIEQSLNPLNVLASILGALLLVALAGMWRQVHSYEAARLRATQEALLNRLTSRIRESLELPTIIQTTVTELAALGQLKRVLFAWHSPDINTFEIISDSGNSTFALPPLAATIQADLASCFQLEKTVSFTIPGSTTIALEVPEKRYIALAIPAPDGRIGYLLGLHHGQLCSSDRELVKAVICQLEIAVNQSFLYSQTHHQVELLNQTLTKLNQAQTHLVQSEKMSSLGQLVAGIAHEINNPVNFIHGNLVHANQYAEELLDLIKLYEEYHPTPHAAVQQRIDDLDLDFVSKDFLKLLDSMKVGTHRIKEIVQSLRVFSRLDEAEVKDVNIHEGIDSTLMILQSRLKARPGIAAVEVVKNYGAIPPVECYAGQLNQVFMNIIGNAIDALEESGMRCPDCDIKPTLTITTRVIALQTSALCLNLTEHDTASSISPILHLVVHIRDNGPGIPEAVQSRIFDPFFTTKPVGHGTGMGLAISYQVITERHHGKLYCLSEPGKGTEFMIEIPVHQSELSS